MWRGLAKKYTEAVYSFSQFQAIYNSGVSLGWGGGIVLIATHPQKFGSFLARKATALLSEDTAITRRIAQMRYMFCCFKAFSKRASL